MTMVATKLVNRNAKQARRLWLGLLWSALVLAATGPAQPQNAPEEPDTDGSEAGQAAVEEEEQEVKLPKLDEMVVPSAEELLHGPRRDWIVFNSQEVLVCEPVYPRPNTLEKMQSKIDAYPSYSGPRDPESLQKYRERFDRLHHFDVALPGDEQLYRLHMRYVSEIIHHEDLMIRRANSLMAKGNFREAYELLFVVERRYTEWPDLQESRQRLLFLEASDDFKNGRSETALVRLEQLHEDNPAYRGLASRLGEVTDSLVTGAVQQGDFRRARHFLMRMRRKEPNHSVVARWVETLRERATVAINRAQELYESGEYAEAARLADEAALIWPNTPGLPATPNLRPTHHRLRNRFQTLAVGVLRLPDPSNPVFPEDGVTSSAAGRRHRQLTQTKLFEIGHSDDAPHYRSRLLEQWDPTNLGRRAVFTLRQNRSYWEPHPVVTASPVVAAMADRLDPSGPRYDARFADHIRSVSVLSPFRFEVRFSRVPLRTESLFTFPVAGPDDGSETPTAVTTRSRSPAIVKSRAASDGDPSAAARLRGSSPAARFVVHEHTDDRIVYRRTVPEPDRAERFHVAEIIERKYDSYDDAVQGLMRGEVSMLPRAPSWAVPLLAEDGRFETVERAVPVTHLLLFNPRSRAARHRELRRALAYALDRERILREVVLRDPDRARGRLVSGPFPTRGLSAIRRRVPGYAYNTRVDSMPHNPLLAAALALAAGKQLGEKDLQLRLVCPPDPVQRAAAERMVEAWSRVGIEVALLPDDRPPTAASSEWDLLYRAVTMTDPVRQLWPLLTMDRAARVGSLEFLPDWLRQELIDLDRASDWETAVALLQQLHEHLAAEVQLIPLWEVDDFLVIRENIRGYPAAPLRAYHDVERWTVTPWFAEGTP